MAARTGSGMPDLGSVLSAGGTAPLVPRDVAAMAAEMATAELRTLFGAHSIAPVVPKTPPAGKGKTPGKPRPPCRLSKRIKAAVVGSVPTYGLALGPPPPPLCASPPPEPVAGKKVRMSMAPFQHSEADGKGGGFAWPLADGSWAFQYPNMVLRVSKNGATRIAWAPAANPAVTGTRTHKEPNGDVVYYDPTGTFHRVEDTLIYHWCTPNVVVYQTPNGLVYHDATGMTYSGRGVAHYSQNGEVLYQGEDGVTLQRPNGEVVHWTNSGVIYRHANGITTYTAVGESEPRLLENEALGPDPYPGPPLSKQELLRLARLGGQQPAQGKPGRPDPTQQTGAAAPGAGATAADRNSLSRIAAHMAEMARHMADVSREVAAVVPQHPALVGGVPPQGAAPTSAPVTAPAVPAVPAR